MVVVLMNIKRRKKNDLSEWDDDPKKQNGDKEDDGASKWTILLS